GIMDQMAASLADAHTALFLDTRSLEYRRIPLPSQADLVVIDSGVTHGIVSGEYNARRADCEAAAAQLGVDQVRDLTLDDIGRLDALDQLRKRRARHVIAEDARVLQAVEALEESDLPRLGELFYASHRSMRDDFDVSTPEVDQLVELGQTDADV